MGFSEGPESFLPLLNPEDRQIPQDSFNFAYIIHFTFGVGFLLPWNAFITAVDYFSRLYPSGSTNRIFAAIYMPTQMISLLIILLFSANKYKPHVRINLGLGLLVAALLVVPVTNWVYVKGRVGLYSGFYVTVGALAFAGVGDALMQSGVFGAAGELPKRYMQATIAGTAGSGVLVSFLRILTKAVFPQDADEIRNSANLYFSVGIIALIICILFYNIGRELPVIQYYEELKIQAINDEGKKGSETGHGWRKTLKKLQIIRKIKWHLFGIVIINTVTLCIYPGCVTESVDSEVLKDWFPVLLITAYNVFDLLGKSLTGLLLPENEKLAVRGCVGKLLYYPLFWVCLNGPGFFRTEAPVTVLTCLLGFTKGYLSGVMMFWLPNLWSYTTRRLLELWLSCSCILAKPLVLSWLGFGLPDSENLCCNN